MTNAERSLGRLAPALAHVRFVPLGEFPTPVEPLHLAAVVPGFSGRVWVKREDLSAPVVGGNKLRKLEYLFGEAGARGAETIVTAGALGSNHCLATAYHGASVGFRAHLVLFPQRLTEASRRKFRGVCALGDGFTFCPWATATPLVVSAVRARLGSRAYAIPPGGSSVLGVIGFANAGLELAEQVAAGALEPPDAVFTAAATGGSAAGLALGLQLGGLICDVVGVRVYPPPTSSAAWMRSLASRAHRRLEHLAGERLRPFDPSRITVVRHHLGRGYAQPTPAAEHAEQTARTLGLTLDGTYTAKAFAAFLDAAASPAYRDRRLVFVLTYDPRLPEGLGDDVKAGRLPARLRAYL